MKPRIRSLLLACAAVVAVTGCDDPLRPDANLSVFERTVTLYSLNGSPPSAPTGLLLYDAQAIKADASFLFDLAFDVESDGRVTVLPVRAVSGGLNSAHRVGLQR